MYGKLEALQSEIGEDELMKIAGKLNDESEENADKGTKPKKGKSSIIRLKIAVRAGMRYWICLMARVQRLWRVNRTGEMLTAWSLIQSMWMRLLRDGKNLPEKRRCC